MACLWALVIVNLSIIVHFGLISRPPLSLLLHELSRFDLVLHCLAFCSLSIPVFMLFRPMLRAGSGIFLLGIGLELAQWMTTSREASITDIAANGSGILLAALFVVMLKRADFEFLRPVLARAA